jgi:hypothetical protein
MLPASPCPADPSVAFGEPLRKTNAVASPDRFSIIYSSAGGVLTIILRLEVLLVRQLVRTPATHAPACCRKAKPDRIRNLTTELALGAGNPRTHREWRR